MRVAVLSIALFVFACDGGGDGSDGGPADADGGVDISGPLEVVSFTASRSEVNPTASVDLEWVVRGARIVEISTRDTTLVSAFRQTGTVSTGPLRETSTYTLKITRGEETKTATLDITVNWPTPEIFFFSAEPQMTTVNNFITIQWSTSGAEYLRLLKNGMEFTRILSNTAGGSIQSLVDEEITTFTLEAVNPQHVVSSSPQIVRAEIPPQVLSFRIQPRLLFPETRTATVTWRAIGAFRTDLYDLFGRPVAGFPGTLTGTITVSVNPTEIHEFRLIAYGQQGQQAEGYRRIGPPAIESEPNNDVRFANSLWDSGGARGELSSASDVDVYTVFPQPGSSLRVWITGSDGEGCETDTEVELRSFGEELARDSDHGAETVRGGFCGLIDPDLMPRAQKLFEGQYFIVVSGSESGRYVIVTEEE